ncbi:MAG: hypothetical protein AVDCRST_MAG12-781 [uncultured Rubrobacteraceae bacterium]|uniref:Uncharacterized protein n=1 Tax=uncultured Rubrobacteraceae bacterium TaxID=349277 RepID=A0A6J4RJI2_9ACTN|nr:MAG: hypothetical protein AVDCRST_MAG12-781 [uncultured Rubrobacteraceae bacterium]
MKDQVLHVVEVLLVERLVEPELAVDRLDDRRAGVATGAQRCRVGAREDVEDDEGEPADHEEQHEDPEQSAGDVRSHGFLRWGEPRGPAVAGRPPCSVP